MQKCHIDVYTHTHTPYRGVPPPPPPPLLKNLATPLVACEYMFSKIYLTISLSTYLFVLTYMMNVGKKPKRGKVCTLVHYIIDVFCFNSLFNACSSNTKNKYYMQTLDNF